MTCEEFGEMLNNYADLSDKDKMLMTEHMEKCAECRDEFDFMMSIIAQLNTLPRIETPEDFAAELNKKLDGIQKSNRILEFARRNYRQLSTAAACLLLAVVIGANGKTLLNRIPSDTSDSVNPVTQALPDTTPAPIGGASQIAANTASEQPKPGAQESKTASKTENRKAVQVAAITGAGNIEPIREMSESINMIEKPDTGIVVPRVADENINGGAVADRRSAEAQNMERIAQQPRITSLDDEDDDNGTSKFKIARGIYYLPETKGTIQNTPQPAEDSNYNVKINKDKDVEIARGVYYIKTDDGVVNTRDNEIEIGSGDAQRALELIEQYADETDSEYYVINTEKITPMLEHMEREGITYQHSIEEEVNERVGFKVKID